jgi:hypothetical protein
MRAQTTVYDLPKDILSTLQPKAETGSEHLQHDTEEPKNPKSADDTQHGTSNGSKGCSLCGLSFFTVEDQRSHTRSDFHNYNLKQKLRGSKPVAEAEFEELVGGMKSP